VRAISAFHCLAGRRSGSAPSDSNGRILLLRILVNNAVPQPECSLMTCVRTIFPCATMAGVTILLPSLCSASVQPAPRPKPAPKNSRCESRRCRRGRLYTPAASSRQNCARPCFALWVFRLWQDVCAHRHLGVKTVKMGYGYLEIVGRCRLRALRPIPPACAVYRPEEPDSDRHRHFPGNTRRRLFRQRLL